MPIIQWDVICKRMQLFLSQKRLLFIIWNSYQCNSTATQNSQKRPTDHAIYRRTNCTILFDAIVWTSIATCICRCSSSDCTMQSYRTVVIAYFLKYIVQLDLIYDRFKRLCAFSDSYNFMFEWDICKHFGKTFVCFNNKIITMKG